MEDPLRQEFQMRNLSKGPWAIFAEDMARINNSEILGTVFIGYHSYVNSGLIRSYVEIGRYCSIGRGCNLGLGHHDLTKLSTSPFFIGEGQSFPLALKDPKRRVLIGNDCWIGDNVMINSGVKIGSGSVLAAGSVVTKDVEPYQIVGGVPASPIKYRFEPEVISRLIDVSWWEFLPEIIQSLPPGDLIKQIEFFEDIREKNLHTDKFPVRYKRYDGMDV